jgi:hypothetical protein
VRDGSDLTTCRPEGVAASHPRRQHHSSARCRRPAAGGNRGSRPLQATLRRPHLPPSPPAPAAKGNPYRSARRNRDTAACLVETLSRSKSSSTSTGNEPCSTVADNPSLGRNFEALDPLEWLARMSDHMSRRVQSLEQGIESLPEPTKL